MTDQELCEITDRAYDLLEPELMEIVANIEGGISTTQNNYGRYMSAISTLTEAGLNIHLAAILLIRTGANKGGVQSAVTILT